jgi:hypothetical protein
MSGKHFILFFGCKVANGSSCEDHLMWKIKPQPRIPKHLWGIKPLKLVFPTQIIYKSKPSYIHFITSKKPCKEKPLEIDYG